MSIKYLPKRMLSGILSAVMAVSVAATPAGALAADTGQGKDISIDEYVASLPGLEEAAGMLDKDEIVTADDYEVAFGEEIDLEKDFSNITIPEGKKVKVYFHEAKNADGKSFSTTRADSYKAVYYVEPVNTAHPAYMQVQPPKHPCMQNRKQPLTVLPERLPPVRRRNLRRMKTQKQTVLLPEALQLKPLHPALPAPQAAPLKSPGRKKPKLHMAKQTPHLRKPHLQKPRL